MGALDIVTMGGPCGVKKGKSKKKQLHRKYREEKLVRQHHKKVKKVARKCKAAGIKAPHKREPTLPNSAPHFKAEFLREAEQHKERVAGEREKRIAEQKAARRLNLRKKRAQSLEDMASTAGKRGAKFEKKNTTKAADDGTRAIAGVRTRAQYMRQLREVVSMSDIVLVVLDARNPMGCRCKTLEDLIMQDTSKRVILVLNKIDLVPREIVHSWRFPSTQQRQNNQCDLGRVSWWLNASAACQELLKESRHQEGSQCGCRRIPKCWEIVADQLTQEGQSCWHLRTGRIHQSNPGSEIGF